ncbi:unnamed protein product [Linum tenue]|uniref:Uncharacterized protein n=1 Tax=Linum tenue TaxID=586396 RepID=A0AAV0NHM9_9ROSI|nr:unnamed protein product [Linum tenue]
MKSRYRMKYSGSTTTSTLKDYRHYIKTFPMIFSLVTRKSFAATLSFL